MLNWPIFSFPDSYISGARSDLYFCRLYLKRDTKTLEYNQIHSYNILIILKKWLL